MVDCDRYPLGVEVDVQVPAIVAVHLVPRRLGERNGI